MKRSIQIVITAVVVGIVVGATIVFASLPKSMTNQACQPGAVVAIVTDAATPETLLNSPFEANRSDWSTGSTYQGNGTYATDYAWNGSVWGSFLFANWTIRVGQGLSTGAVACTQLFFASEGVPYSGGTVPLGNVSGYVNDSGEPGFWQINDSSSGGPVSGGPIYYQNGFYRETTQISTCGLATVSRTAVSNQFVVGVPFTYQGESHVVNATLFEQTSYHYEFPANDGTWAIDNLSAPGGPGGGWAFSYLGPCT
jgi:hypothetical protein